MNEVLELLPPLSEGVPQNRRVVKTLEVFCAGCGEWKHESHYGPSVLKSWNPLCRLCNAAKRKAFYDPVKKAAHEAVAVALSDGTLVKGPCEVTGCGTTDDICAHHDDYAKPLEVRWMCRKHHALHHIA